MYYAHDSIQDEKFYNHKMIFFSVKAMYPVLQTAAKQTEINLLSNLPSAILT